MSADDFSDTALVLLGHGTELNPGSAAPARLHAAELRRRGIFTGVREAFWKQEPRIASVLGEISQVEFPSPDLRSPSPHPMERGQGEGSVHGTISEARVFIVPLFISEGYFSEEVIPRELGFTLTEDPRSRILSRDGRQFIYCLPIGTHPAMTDVILARAREVMAQHPFPRLPKPSETTLFIAGHGTERNARSRESIERQVAIIRERGLYAGVQAVFMDEDPRIAGCTDTAPTRNVVVVPFFISDGLHTQEDIPRLLGEPERLVKQRLESGQPTWRNPTERHGKLIWYSNAVGTAPEVAQVILERVAEAARR